MTDLNTIIHTLFHRLLQVPVTDIKDLDAYIKLQTIFNRLLRTATKLMRAQHRTELKHNMLSDPEWRGRVRRELGGEKTLMRWEARYTKAQKLAREPRLYYQPSYEPPRQAAFNGFRGRLADPGILYDRIKVDMMGQFCLAPVKGWRNRPPRPKVIPYVNPYGLKVHYTDIDPISLTPAELRSGVQDTGTPRRDAIRTHESALQALRETAAKATVMADQLFGERVCEKGAAPIEKQARASPAGVHARQKEAREFTGL